MEKLYTVSKNKTWSWPWLISSTLFLQKNRLKLKKVGKTTRPFRYDLYRIPYDYTVEGMKRFKGEDLVYWMPDKLWTQVYNIVQKVVIKPITPKKKCKKAKWLSEEALKIAKKNKRTERQRRLSGKGNWKGKIYLTKCIFWRIARSGKKAFLNKQCKEIEENKRIGKTWDLLKKIGDIRGQLMQRWAE